MLTITETVPSVFNSSVFAEHRLSTITDSFDGTDMAPISNITLQKNDQTNMSRSENLTRYLLRNFVNSYVIVPCIIYCIWIFQTE
jgi:hypothetical protein